MQYSGSLGLLLLVLFATTSWTQTIARGEQSIVRIGAESVDGSVVLEREGSGNLSAELSTGSGGGPPRAGAAGLKKSL